MYPEGILRGDRGTVDGAAYWPTEQRDFFTDVGSTLEAELDRYDAVLFFESAAMGGISIEGGNPTRIESQHDAVRLDKRLRAIWARHPRVFLIPHSASFVKKILFALAVLESVVAQHDRSGEGDGA